MSHTSQRRRGPDQGHRDAAEGQQEHTPGDADALAALRTLRAWLGGGAALAIYDQRPGHLPPDAKSADAFARRHRALRKANVPDVWVRGKLLCCTAEAWASDLPKTQRPRLTVVAPSNAIDAELGIRARAR